tara:strand:+ start:140 stop:421 length:282 start_codon:yes stop_codon:yes gene_type:complete
MGPNNNQKQKQQQQEAKTNDYELLTPLTKSVLLIFQVLQTVALLTMSWLLANGSDNWLGNLMPEPGTFVSLCLAFLAFVLLWVQRIRVLRNAR